MATIIKETKSCFSIIAVYDDGRQEFFKDFLFSFYEQPFANIGLAMITYGRKFKKYFGKDVDFSDIESNLRHMAEEATDIYEANKFEEALYETYGEEYEGDLDEELENELEEMDEYIDLMERRVNWY